MRNFKPARNIRAVTLLGHLLIQEQEDPNHPEWTTLATIPLDSLKEAWEEWNEISSELNSDTDHGKGQPQNEAGLH